MTETLAHGHSSEGACGELSNKYQVDRVKMVFKILCALDESSSSIGRVNPSILKSSSRKYRLVRRYY